MSFARNESNASGVRGEGAALSSRSNKFRASSRMITDEISRLPGITVVREEITELPSSGFVIIATGPLTSDSLAECIQDLIGEKYLYFYDATSPIIYADSIDYGKVFRGSMLKAATIDWFAWEEQVQGQPPIDVHLW